MGVLEAQVGPTGALGGVLGAHVWPTGALGEVLGDVCTRFESPRRALDIAFIDPKKSARCKNIYIPYVF